MSGAPPGGRRSARRKLTVDGKCLHWCHFHGCRASCPQTGTGSQGRGLCVRVGRKLGRLQLQAPVKSESRLRLGLPSHRKARLWQGLPLGGGAGAHGCRHVDLSPGAAPASPRQDRARPPSEGVVPERARRYSGALKVLPCRPCGRLPRGHSGQCASVPEGTTQGSRLRRWGRWRPSWGLPTTVSKKTAMFLGTLAGRRPQGQAASHPPDSPLRPASWERGGSSGHVPGSWTVALFVETHPPSRCVCLPWALGAGTGLPFHWGGRALSCRTVGLLPRRQGPRRPRPSSWELHPMIRAAPG